MNDTGYVLGLHPTSRGFGWALFEEANVPFDWGAVEEYNDKKNRILFHLERLLERYEPSVLAMEDYEGDASRRKGRIRHLANAITKLARDKGMTVRVFTRDEIKQTFAEAGEGTREEIARLVADHVEALREHLPAKRHIWQSERAGMAVFSAAACALTWYARQT